MSKPALVVFAWYPGATLDTYPTERARNEIGHPVLRIMESGFVSSVVIVTPGELGIAIEAETSHYEEGAEPVTNFVEFLRAFPVVEEIVPYYGPDEGLGEEGLGTEPTPHLHTPTSRFVKDFFFHPSKTAPSVKMPVPIDVLVIDMAKMSCFEDMEREVRHHLAVYHPPAPYAFMCSNTTIAMIPTVELLETYLMNPPRFQVLDLKGGTIPKVTYPIP